MAGIGALSRRWLGLIALGSLVGVPLPAQRVETPFLDSVLVRLAGSGDRFPVSSDICRGHARVVDQICQGLVRSRTGGWYLVPDGRMSASIMGQDPLPLDQRLQDVAPGGAVLLHESFGIPRPGTAGEIRNGIERLRTLSREAPHIAHVWYGLALAMHHVERRLDSALVLLDRAEQVGGLPAGLLAQARARVVLHLGQPDRGSALFAAAVVDTAWVAQAVMRSLFQHIAFQDGHTVFPRPTRFPFDTLTLARVAAQRLLVPPLTRPLVTRSRFYRLDTVSGSDVVVPLAVYRQTLRPSDTLPDGRVHVVLRVRLGAVRVSDGLTIVVDSLRQFVLPPSTLPVSLDHSWLQLAAAITLPPGRFALTWAVMQPDSGGFAGTLPPIEVPTPGSGLQVSSVVAGVTERGLPWPVGSAMIGLHPVAEWRHSERVLLAASIRGLTEGERYRSTLRLYPMQGNDLTTPIVTVTTEDQATGPLTHWSRDLLPGAVPQGSYCIELTIARGTDSVATSDAIEVGSWTTHWMDWIVTGFSFQLPQNCVGKHQFREPSRPAYPGRPTPAGEGLTPSRVRVDPSTVAGPSDPEADGADRQTSALPPLNSSES